MTKKEDLIIEQYKIKNKYLEEYYKLRNEKLEAEIKLLHRQGRLI